MTIKNSKLTTSQAANLIRLINSLHTHSQNVSDVMKAGLTDKNGLVAFYGNNLGGVSITFSEPYGHAPVMLFNGSMITANSVNRIANVFNGAFGNDFYREVLEDGKSANVCVSIKNDVIPHLQAYQRRHDSQLEIRQKKAQREQVRSLLKVVDNPLSDAIAKNIPATTAQRWRTLDKQLTAEIAELEAFA